MSTSETGMGSGDARKLYVGKAALVTGAFLITLACFSDILNLAFHFCWYTSILTILVLDHL